jgi:hypothetical protein
MEHIGTNKVKCNVLSSVTSGIKGTAVMTLSNLPNTCTCLTHVTSYTSAGVHTGQRKKRSETRLITYRLEREGSLVSGHNFPYLS